MPISTLGRAVSYAGMARQIHKIKKSTDDVQAERARALLAQRMGRLRGLPQKVGQLLSMGDDEARADAFGELNDHAEPLPFDAVQPLIEAAWGQSLGDVVSEIDPNGRAASLGQVQRAVLHDSREVAIKVQYPEMDRAIESDLRMLGWLSKPVGDLRRGFDMDGYRVELRRDLDEELDYRTEANHQRAMQQALSNCDGWVVPEVIGELSTDKVLVTAWEPGESIDAVASWPDDRRRLLGRRLLNGFFHTVFRTGLIHADPNPGNYRFRLVGDDPQVLLYDYGCVHRLSPQKRLMLLKLIAMTTAQQGDPFKVLVGLGFNGELLEPLREKLPAVCSVLCAPFAGSGDDATWRLGERMGDILGSDRWNFRIAGPPDLIWLLRAFRGVSYYLSRMDAYVSWEFAIRPFLTERAAELAAIDVSSPQVNCGLEGQARHLRIRVRKDGREKVSLTFPALAVDDLESLMDANLRDQLEQDGIELSQFVKRVRQEGYRPQSIFCLEDDERFVEVWLE